MGAMAVLPYAMTLQGITKIPSIPLMLLQNSLIYAFLVFMGLKLSIKHFNILLVSGSQDIKWSRFFMISIVSGLLVGSSIIILDRFIFPAFVNEAVYQTHTIIPKWQGLLASLYGSVNEEVLLRLFLMGFIYWLLIKKMTNTKLAVILSIVISTLAFGAGHLPAIYQMIDSPSALDISRVLVLNGIAGITFGILYWKQSLESAMLAHFVADILLHVVM